MVAFKSLFDKLMRKYGLYWNVYSLEDLIRLKAERRRAVISKIMEEKEKEHEELRERARSAEEYQEKKLCEKLQAENEKLTNSKTK
ncbi:unnamed protein product [Enterobius vermicularis]|uniref:Uncharacterized protein n=1 Tax=Enterobius vermicularis TaxID=51028 RepID=A0A0N4UW70_ENTVE|nr:unnamed protein product [Enterobius vermicularis]